MEMKYYFRIGRIAEKKDLKLNNLHNKAFERAIKIKEQRCNDIKHKNQLKEEKFNTKKQMADQNEMRYEVFG